MVFILCLAKTSYPRKMNYLVKSSIRTVPPTGPRPRKPGSPSAIASSARQTTSPSIDCPAQVVLGRVEKVLVRVDKASRLGHSQNRRELASGWLPVVLDMGFKSQTSGRTKAGEQRSPCADLSHGC